MAVAAAVLLELGLILTVLTILGSLARRFALSPIPLYLLAGLALGDGASPRFRRHVNLCRPARPSGLCCCC